MSHRTKGISLAFLAAGLALVVSASRTVLPAQILRVPEKRDMGRPISGSLSVGFLQTQDRFDGQSNTFWRLGEAISYRAAVDVGIRSGAIGLAASVASVPIERFGPGLSGADGDIQLRQYLATFRTREVEGFHQVLEISLGMAQWASYSGPDVLTDEEAKPRNALAMAIGYGFGFTVGKRASIVLVQDLGTLIGSKEGLPSGESRAVRQYTTRIGARVRLAGSR